jgi:hypothetical protein
MRNVFEIIALEQSFTVSCRQTVDVSTRLGPLRRSRIVEVRIIVLVIGVSVEGDRPCAEFTPRVIPHHPSASVPLEAGQILWQK